MSINLACSISRPWSWEEDKAFENALAVYYGHVNCLEKIAAVLPGRTIEEVGEHLRILSADVEAIDAGHVPLPPYEDFPINCDSRTPHGQSRNQSKKIPSQSGSKEGSLRLYGRKKGKPWSSEEHGLFIQGLKKFGRGDWRSISRQCVLTKTSTQVASHAQKYFKRLDEVNTARKRSSIHDMSILDNGQLVTRRMVTRGEEDDCVRESLMNTAKFPTLDSSLIVSDNDKAGVHHLSFLSSSSAAADGGKHPPFKIPGPDFSSYQWTPNWTEQMSGFQNDGLVFGSSCGPKVTFPQGNSGFSGLRDNNHGFSFQEPCFIQQNEAPPPVSSHQSMSTFGDTFQRQSVKHLEGTTIQNDTLIDKGKRSVKSTSNDWEDYLYDFKDLSSASSFGFNSYDYPTVSQSFLPPPDAAKVGELDGFCYEIPSMDYYNNVPTFGSSFSNILRDLEEFEFPPSPSGKI